MILDPDQFQVYLLLSLSYTLSHHSHDFFSLTRLFSALYIPLKSTGIERDQSFAPPNLSLFIFRPVKNMETEQIIWRFLDNGEGGSKCSFDGT